MRTTFTFHRPFTARGGVPIFGVLLVMNLLTTAGCATDIAPSDDVDGDAGDDAGDVREDPNMTHADQGDHTETQVDATDEEAWIYLDLDTGEQVMPSDPNTDTDWDVRFKRFNIALNGGVSGSGVVEATFVDGVFLEGLDAIPDTGWITDLPDGDDEDAEPDLALGAWYDYNPDNHVLTPHPGVFVIRTPDADYGFEMLDYYNDAGTSGFPTFAWKAVHP